MSRLIPKSEAEHNREMEAFQRHLDHTDQQDRLFDRAEVIDSGHTLVAPTVTYRALKTPSLDELDQSPDE